MTKEREQKSLTDKYPWLDPDDERKCMIDREILDKYMNLNNSCLDKERRQRQWICYTNIEKHLVLGMK